MKVTTKYAEIEKITYTFGTADIKRALIDTFRLKPGPWVDLELYEEYEGKSQYAELIITFKKDKKVKK